MGSGQMELGLHEAFFEKFKNNILKICKNIKEIPRCR
jgi:hypothetical protein